MRVSFKDLIATSVPSSCSSAMRGDRELTWTHRHCLSQSQHLTVMSSLPVKTRLSVGWTVKHRM